MTSFLFHNALSAELCAAKQKIQELEKELQKTRAQRDLIKFKWEKLNELHQPETPFENTKKSPFKSIPKKL